MHAHAHAFNADLGHTVTYPVGVRLQPVTENRNRLTSAFRLILAIPHLILVGGPAAMLVSMGWSSENGWTWEWSSGAGVLGAVAAAASMIAWFAILFTGRHPQGLWKLVAFYLRWRVRAIAYFALLRDEFPPFGDGPYPVDLELSEPDSPRDRLTIAFRFILALPHLVVLWALGLVWALTTVVAWFNILFTGHYPERLYKFAVDVMSWGARVEAYMLLLRDEYPPFALE
jgi:hypothetical protein